MQDKISLRLEGNRFIPTDRNGTYILKPVPSGGQLEHRESIAANEHLSMQISRQVFGINTALSALIPFKDGELAYITRRFDYTKEGEKLDQEDMASVLQMTEETAGRNYKYEGSYEEVAEAIARFVPAYMPTLEDFYRPSGRTDYAMTPSYDLLYTRYHVKETFGDMGLELFRDYETKAFGIMGSYMLEDFEAFAEMIGLPRKRLIKIFTPQSSHKTKQ